MVKDDAAGVIGDGCPVSVVVRASDDGPQLELVVPESAVGTPEADVAREMMRLEMGLPWWECEPGLSVRDPDASVVRAAAGVAAAGFTSPAARLLASTAPGPTLVDRLDRTSLADADDAAVVELVAAWERIASWAVSQQARAITELGARRRAANSSAGARSAVFEVEARLGITQYAAESKTSLALGLEDYPVVADALNSGHIDARKAEVLLHAEPGLPARVRRTVLDELVPEADTLTVPQLRERIRAAALAADAATASRRHAEAVARRHVSIEPAGDTMAWVSAFVRADHAMAARTALDALAVAAKTPGDTRTLDQRRADSFTDVFTSILDNGVDFSGRALPVLQRRRPHLQVTVAGGTLLGLDDQPGVLGGYGPIPAELARRIAQDATWQALFTDAGTGEFVALGTKAYRPGADLTRTVLARDVTCVFMGCRIPAWRCEIDHQKSYDKALADSVVQTDQDKVDTKCHSHHDVKTAKLWDTTRDPTTGITWWRAPTGHRYARKPVRPPGPPPTGPPPARPPTGPGAGRPPAGPAPGRPRSTPATDKPPAAGGSTDPWGTPDGRPPF
ncbi:DUF222 domain-containing protein [Georgenia subflava]|uniref:DUF222 domain-containing protein n=1 Tax=Georgenia subflava TaxID=1622177 RepID=UPI00186B19D3|nr:DUF222 domain-containing protein [Georgenia subflava]